MWLIWDEYHPWCPPRFILLIFCCIMSLGSNVACSSKWSYLEGSYIMSYIKGTKWHPSKIMPWSSACPSPLLTTDRWEEDIWAYFKAANAGAAVGLRCLTNILSWCVTDASADGPLGSATSCFAPLCSPQWGHAQQMPSTGGSPPLPTAVVLLCGRVALWKVHGVFSGLHRGPCGGLITPQIALGP